MDGPPPDKLCPSEGAGHGTEADDGPPDDPEHARALFAHATKTVEIFLDWRHRVMQFTFVADSALIGLAAWMYRNDLEAAIAAPLLLVALINAAAAGFDRRNEHILQWCYCKGARLARQMGSVDGGPFAWIRDSRPKPMKFFGHRLNSYNGILSMVYWSTAVVALVCAAAIVHDPPRPAETKSVASDAR
jgi:hypothetical protein